MSNLIFRLAQEIDGFHNFNEAKEFFLTTLMKRDNGYFYITKKLQQIEENDAIYFVYDGNIVAKAKFLGEIKTNTDRDEKFIEGHKVEVLNVFDIGLKIEPDLLQQKTTRSIGYINEKDTNILENIINKISKNKILNNLEVKNIILYGAPGVGKTHNYKNLISMIEDGITQNEIFDVVSKNQHVDLKNDVFESIKKDGRVEFVTFHQSYSYEDFIEGFRPNELGNIELENGIFKTIVEKCIENSFNLEIETGIQDISEKPTIWKMSLGEGGEIKEECFENNKIRLGWDNFGDLNSVDSITQRELRDFYTLEIGDIVFAFKNQWEIDGIGVVIGAYRFNDNNDNYKHERDVNWIVKNKIINVKEYNNNVRMTLSSLYRLYRISKLDVLSIIQDSHQDKSRKSSKIQKNFYIVIDEINRGNISKIFGELITLIEEDKRDIYEVTLPYSKEKFKVPSNLYIIATMNSTDKSIATIDIALRRRFTFLKMKPNVDLIKNDKAKKLFNALNEFIKNSLNEDYMLGHSYFMKVNSDDDLEFVKEYKIKPLLEEYFYADDENLKEIVDILDKETTDEQK